jgi:phosphohistidine phosphatase
MSKHLHDHAIAPELVLCSSAVRARETLVAIEGALGSGVDVRVEDELYGAGSDAVLERLRKVDDAASVMVIGHNPGLEDLVVGLAGTGDQQVMDRLDDGLPTAALAVIRLAADNWNDVALGGGELVELVLPRELS